MQIAAADRGRPDVYGLVGELDDGGFGVGGRVHGDGLDPELAARARNAERDLASVRDQDLFEQGCP